MYMDTSFFFSKSMRFGLSCTYKQIFRSLKSFAKLLEGLFWVFFKTPLYCYLVSRKPGFWGFFDGSSLLTSCFVCCTCLCNLISSSSSLNNGRWNKNTVRFNLFRRTFFYTCVQINTLYHPLHWRLLEFY